MFGCSRCSRSILLIRKGDKMKELLPVGIVIYSLLIGAIVSGCVSSSNHEVSMNGNISHNENTSSKVEEELDNDEVSQAGGNNPEINDIVTKEYNQNVRLKWRQETKWNETGDVLTSELYLYSEDNNEIECKVGGVVGELNDVKYKDRYPEDAIIPLDTWFGGGGTVIVGKILDKNTLVLMIRGIGDSVGYSTKWSDYNEWYKVEMIYNEEGKIQKLISTPLMESEEVM